MYKYKNVKASIEVSGPLSSLSVSPCKKLIAIGGRDVLKIVGIDPFGLNEKRNLRAGKVNLNFSTNDLKWHPQNEQIIATAATNGAVVVWNLQREGFKNAQEMVYSEHQRAVNRLCWHPSHSNILISGSQDGTIKLWDTRMKSAKTYRPKSESVRDVQFSPFHASKFASAFESGIVQIWDIRKTTVPEQKFTAHKGLILALDWHPQLSDILATGSRDRTIKVWNVMDSKHPQYTIQTIASVGRIQWRPNMKNHIASSASLMDNSLYVWDIENSYNPIAVLKGHEDIASGIQWLDTPIGMTAENASEAPSLGRIGCNYWQHLLSCSKDSSLKLHSIAESYQPHKHLCNVSLALNPRCSISSSYNVTDRSTNKLSITRHCELEASIFTVPNPVNILQRYASRSISSIGRYDDLQYSSYDAVDIGSQTLPLPSNDVHSKIPLAFLAGGNNETRESYSQYSVNSIQNVGNLSTNDSKVTSTTSSKHLDNPSVYKYAHILVARFVQDEILQQKNAEQNSKSADTGQLVELFGFDHNSFCFFAENYKLFGDSFTNMCDHNANMAEISRKVELVQLWKVLKILYQPNAFQCASNLSSKSRIVPTKIENLPENTATDDTNQTALLLQQLDNINPNATQGFEPSPYEMDSSKPTNSINGIDSTPLSSSSDGIANGDSALEWRRLQDSVVKELLKYYSDIGDVQTCVAIAMVINSVTTLDNVLSQSWLQQLYMYYIELLHQFQLHTAANGIIRNCPDTIIKQMNMKSTTMYTNCSKCSKSLDPSRASVRLPNICLNCSNIASECSICQQPANGLFVWCPVCSHGGHLDHMEKWFKLYDVCPTGCSHKCFSK